MAIRSKKQIEEGLQWHTNDLNQVSFDYQINGIPRFVVIDPEGNIY